MRILYAAVLFGLFSGGASAANFDTQDKIDAQSKIDAAAFVIGTATAGEMTVPLAMSGDWSAAAHKPDMISPPDICVASNRKGLGFRADSKTFQVRMTNESWSLPVNVQGEILISIGTWSRSLSIAANTDTGVAAIMDPDDLAPMFAAMDRASTMSVKVGKAPPVVMSLSGSTKVTNAFRTCAGIKSNAKTPGGNPFE
jgi:hypothetical protein